MKIGDRDIGCKARPYIIAELGVNHDGDIGRALELVDAAAEAGADAIKVQLFDAHMLMSRDAKLALYQKAAGESEPVEMLQRLQLSPGQLARVAERAWRAQIDAIASVFSIDLVSEAERIGFDAYKSASPDIINRPLLERLAATGSPLIISTGAAELPEVDRALGWLTPIKDQLGVLQCVSSYPTPWDEAALGGIRVLAERHDGAVGYSDHTVGVAAASHAVALGATILEKHVTFDTDAEGPDHAASLQVEELDSYREHAYAGLRLRSAVGGVRDPSKPRDLDDIERYFRMPDGDLADLAEAGWLATEHPAEKVVLDCERDVREVSRQSLVAARDLPAGHVLTASDLTIKRPGTGLAPYLLGDVLGQTLRAPAEADTLLTPDHVALAPERLAG
ncbi:MAG: N-acetylneuraminate synthase family protein [Planctomycetota bacterium]